MTVDKSQGLDNECILISCSKKGGKEHLMNVIILILKKIIDFLELEKD